MKDELLSHRVEDLLSKMTLEEKVAQLAAVPVRELVVENEFSSDRARLHLENGIGQITRIAGSLDVGPGKAAKIANDIQRFLLEETRPAIPALMHEECLSGFMARGATTFPQAIGMASTWNPDLIRQMSSVIRRQMRAVGAHQGLSPVLDVARDPRWGRTEETFGEDPYLVARMGVAYVRGLQGEGYPQVAATPKHFAGYAFSEGGRNLAPVHLGPRELRETYLTPFEAVVRLAGALSLMNAYHEIDGVPCAASRQLLTQILRQEWGFEGFVVSDYGAIKMLRSLHHMATDEAEAASISLEAGIDVELAERVCYGEPLLKAVRSGRVSESVVDLSVSRVLRGKLILGIFDHPYVKAAKADSVFDAPEDRRLALEVARESIILLKNDSVLPLSSDVGSMAVIGPSADSTRNLHGDYSYTAHVARDWDAVETVSVLRALQDRVGKERVAHAQGCTVTGDSTEGFEGAVSLAGNSDVAVIVIGERSGLTPEDTSGEGRDRSDLRMPGVQEDLVMAVAETGTPLIVVLINGRPLSIARISETSNALIEAWLPGEEGGTAIGDVIFGDYNPSGRLPISIPRNVGQIPVHYSRKPSSMRDYVFGSSRPIYPFGHGLSYTRFEYEGLKIDPGRIDSGGMVEIELKVANAGERAGQETVQLYISDKAASMARPAKELRGFTKLALDPGESKQVRFGLHTDQLAFYDEDLRLVVEPGKFEVLVGSSSDDVRLSGTFVVKGRERRVGPGRRMFAQAASE